MLPIKTDQIDGVIERILDGVSLRDALKSTGLTPQAFHRRLQGDRSRAVAYAHAQQLRADFLADELLEIADGEDDAAKARNRIDVRKWLASKLHTQKYGDRVELNVSQTIDIGATLAEARSRLLPMRYQSETIDGQVIDLQGINEAKPSDNESLTASNQADPARIPDIFD